MGILQKLFGPRRALVEPEWKVTVDGRCLAIAFSPDGGRAVFGTDQGRLCIQDRMGARRLDLDLDLGSSPINSAAFSPDGNTIAVGFGCQRGTDEVDGGLILLDANSGRVKVGHRNYLSKIWGHWWCKQVEFTPDRLVALSIRHARDLTYAIRLFDWNATKLVKLVRRHADATHASFVLSPDGKLAAVQGTVWDLAGASESVLMFRKDNPEREGVYKPIDETPKPWELYSGEVAQPVLRRLQGAPLAFVERDTILSFLNPNGSGRYYYLKEKAKSDESLMSARPFADIAAISSRPKGLGDFRAIVVASKRGDFIAYADDWNRPGYHLWSMAEERTVCQFRSTPAKLTTASSFSSDSRFFAAGAEGAALVWKVP